MFIFLSENNSLPKPMHLLKYLIMLFHFNQSTVIFLCQGEFLFILK